MFSWVFERNFGDGVRTKSKGMFLAKALFDNIAETPDELAFRRGDVLTVVEQDASGLEGWWLCSLRGKHGIAPGNRLKILSGMGDTAKSAMDVSEQQQPGASVQDYDVPPANRGTLDHPRVGSTPPFGFPGRRASNDLPRSGPGSRAGSRKASLANDLYDTPPSAVSKWSSVGDNGIYDTPPSSKRTSSERTPPPSNRSSATSQGSGSSSFLTAAGGPSPASCSPSPSPVQHLLNLPPGVLQHRRRSGGSTHSATSGDNCYDTPPGSNRSSLERILSEEGPPIYESLSPTGSTEHLNEVATQEEPTYDTPPNRGPVQQLQPNLPSRPRQRSGLSHTSATSQSSLHSAPSVESLLSSLSHLSPSLPDSARSSMDLPPEATYDVPPSNDTSRKQLSTDSGLGFYDSPIKSRPSSSASGNGSVSGKTGTLKSSQSTFNCKPSPSPTASTQDIKRSRSMEHALDDLYDTPKNNAPKVNLKKIGGPTFSSSTALHDPSATYDVPPQAMRDSVISARSDSSGEDNQRLSSSSLDCERILEMSPVWDMLPLSLDSALEMLVKRQQDVSKATSRLASFVTDNWRTRASLEKTLYDIKVSCSLVRSSLQEFVEFSLKAVGSATRLPDKQLAIRLQKLLSPLQSTLEFVNKSLGHLEESKWQVALLCEPIAKNKPDDLGQIALVAQDLLPEVKKTASIIQSNAAVLFRKSGDYKPMSAVSAKPPIGNKAMLHRPLPAVPVSNNDNSNTIINTSAAVMSPASSKMSLYDIKAALHQDDYVECDELPPSPTSQNQQGKQMAPEYDYVELDSTDASSAKTTNLKSADEESFDGDTLKARKTKDASSRNTDITPEGSSAVSGSSVDYDVDTVPVKESSSGEEKTPTSKSAPISDSNMTDASHYSDESLSEQDLKTPVNVNSEYDSSDTFVLPSPTKDAPEETPEETVLAEEDDTVLDPSDRQVLVYYADQMSSHSTLLANATDAFLAVVNGGQAPSVFISHSKFIIVSAHKLVHMGDSAHRSLHSNTLSSAIMDCANGLCDCLKASVTATKTAALQFPSGPAIQEMVDSVMAVSHAAHELRLVITQAIR